MEIENIAHVSKAGGDGRDMTDIVDQTNEPVPGHCGSGLAAASAA